VSQMTTDMLNVSYLHFDPVHINYLLPGV